MQICTTCSDKGTNTVGLLGIVSEANANSAAHMPAKGESFPVPSTGAK